MKKPEKIRDQWNINSRDLAKIASLSFAAGAGLSAAVIGFAAGVPLFIVLTCLFTSAVSGQTAFDTYRTTRKRFEPRPEI